MSMLSKYTFWKHNLALDVGTAGIRVGTGVKRLIEQRSAPAAKRALCGGAVVDGDALVAILEPLLAQGRAFGIVKPRVLACAPSDVGRSERELLIESIFRSRASSVVVIPEPIAAAVGAGINVSSPLRSDGDRYRRGSYRLRCYTIKQNTHDLRGKDRLCTNAQGDRARCGTEWKDPHH